VIKTAYWGTDRRIHIGSKGRVWNEPKRHARADGGKTGISKERRILEVQEGRSWDHTEDTQSISQFTVFRRYIREMGGATEVDDALGKKRDGRRTISDTQTPSDNQAFIAWARPEDKMGAKMKDPR